MNFNFFLKLYLTAELLRCFFSFARSAAFIFVFLSLSSIFTFCTGNESRYSKQVLDVIIDTPNIQYQNLVESALSDWDIGLENNSKMGLLRNITPGYAYNPQNWITVADSNCNAKGIPYALRTPERCTLAQDRTIGLCFVTAYASGPQKGQIIHTTIIVKDTILEGTTYSDMEKKAIFVHEIGHCIGLQHWGNTQTSDSPLEPSCSFCSNPHVTHVMYPSTAGNNVPYQKEKEAVQAVYADPAGCSSANPSGNCVKPMDLPDFDSCSKRSEAEPAVSLTDYEDFLPCYYSQSAASESNLEHERHYNPHFPEFTLSGSIGNSYTHGETPQLGKPITGDVMSVLYLFKSDGTEEVRYIKGP